MASMKSVRLKARAGTALNDIVAYIFDEKPSLPGKANKFELIEGTASIFGSGDTPIVEIYIRYAVDDHDKLDDIGNIIDIAAERGDEIEIIVDDVSPE